MSTDLRLSAQRALYGQAGPSLIRFTGEFRDNTVFLQWVIFDVASEDEIEDYRCVGTEIISDYYDARIEEEFVTVRSLRDAEAIKPLGTPFFCRSLRSEY